MARDVEQAVMSLLARRLSGVDVSEVSEALARELFERIDIDAAAVATAAVADAIDEIDDETFDDAFEVVRNAVVLELDRRAKAAALDTIRELASKAMKPVA